MITYDDFMKLEIRTGKVVSAEKVENTDKLLMLKVELGTEIRQVVAGIAMQYAPELLVGKDVVVLANLEPRIIRGVESNGMILAASVDGAPVILMPEKPVPPGTIVK